MVEHDVTQAVGDSGRPAPPFPSTGSGDDHGNRALVVGATGIAGRGVSQELLDAGARVHGLSRRREGIVPGVEHVAADLFDPASVAQAR